MSINKPNRKSIIPFWRPWGPMGCLWRTIVFLLGIILLCILFSLLRQCGRDPNKDRMHDYSERFRETPLPTEDGNLDQNNPLPLPDTIPGYNERERAPIVDDWNETIPDVPELPVPAENFIPPLDESRIVEDP